MILRYNELNSINENITEAKSTIGVFKSFLKVISSLKLKVEKDVTTEFLYFYKYKGATTSDVKDSINRFRSIVHITSHIDYRENICNIYYGINKSGILEFGFFSDTEMYLVGSIEMTDKNIKSILSIDSSILEYLKIELINLSKKKLKILTEVIDALFDYNPGQKLNGIVSIDNNVASVYYKGLGRWENGSIIMSSYNSIASEFKTYINTKKIAKDILVAPYAKDMGIGFKVKLK